MADLTITPANVSLTDYDAIGYGLCFESIAIMSPVWFDSTTGLWRAADADHATVEGRSPTAIAFNTVFALQPFAFVRPNLGYGKGPDINLGPILTAGVGYYLSKNPGKIAPFADISGGRGFLIGVAQTSSILRLVMQDSGGNVA